jgi:hypothetical protein
MTEMTESKTACGEPSFILTREDNAFFIRNLWEALITPTWTRDDIIELGKAVFAKIPLSKLDDKKFNQLLPYLSKMSENLARRIHAHIISEQETMLAAIKSAAVSTPLEKCDPPPAHSQPSLLAPHEDQPAIVSQNSTEMTGVEPATPPTESDEK